MSSPITLMPCQAGPGFGIAARVVYPEALQPSPQQPCPLQSTSMPARSLQQP